VDDEPRIIPLFNVEQTVSADKPSITLPYLVTGTEDDAVVRALIEDTDNVPDIYQELWQQEYAINHLGAGVWGVRVPYGKDQPGEAGKVTLNIDCASGTVHITHSIETVASYAIGNDGTTIAAPDQKKGIGLSGDGKLEGTDIPSAEPNYTITKRYDVGELDEDYIDQLTDLCRPAHTNQDEWVFAHKGFTITRAIGEVAFLGFTYSDPSSDLVEFVYKFKVIPNLTDVGQIGDIPGANNPAIPKKGWEYLWVLYREGRSNNFLTRTPAGVYVEKVLPPGDFSKIKI
jgi:hypothetical protein